MAMRIGTKIGLIAVGSVVLAGLAVAVIPQPIGAVVAGTIGVCAGLWIRSYFDNLKGY